MHGKGQQTPWLMCLSQPTGSPSMPPTPTSASSKWTSIRRRTIRAMCPARPAGTGRPSSATRSSRDIIPIKKLEELLGKSGIDNKTTIVLYGDNNNWFAAWAFWQLKIYGHEDVRIMDGGRKKWLAEGRDLSTDKPAVAAKTYKATGPGLVAARVPAGSAAGVGRARRRRSSTSAARGIHRRDPRAARAAGNLPARRPHSRREEHPRGARTATTTGRSRAWTS